jgi:hypothetical protein
LHRQKYNPKIYGKLRKEIDRKRGILWFADVVIDKSRSNKMELVKWQYWTVNT